MSEQISLKQVETSAFRSAFDDGLWDVFLGCFVLMFALAPLLSERLGDFWSSMVFLPFWGLVYLVIWLVRRYVVTPRIGVVRFGRARKARLTRFSVAMVAINVFALILGLIAAANIGRFSGQVTAVVFGMIFLIAFSLMAYFLDVGRLYVYGLMMGVTPFAGEWLFVRGYASHHGYPVVFGIAAGVMIAVGLVLFLRLLRDNPLPADGFGPEGA